MNKQIKKTPLSHFHLIKKATIDDFKDISEWLKDALKIIKNLRVMAFIIICTVLYMKLSRSRRSLCLDIKAKPLLF